MTQRVRSWVFTWNNYPEDWKDSIARIPHLEYYVGGREKAPETGTPHIQGYLYVKEKISMVALKKATDDAIHWEIAKGNHQQASDYCKKDGDYEEWGKLPEQGRRNDIKAVKEVVSSGGGMAGVIEVATSYQSLKCAEVLLKYIEKPRDWQPEVHYIYGPSGAGKSRMAREITNGMRTYTKNSSSKWWEGYDSHLAVILDDFRDSWFELTYLLGLLDRYEFRVECKGGSRQLLAKVIVITSVIPPEELYRRARLNEDVNGQIMRRITRVVRLDAPL